MWRQGPQRDGPRDSVVIRVIARLHAGHDDFMHSPDGVDVLILVCRPLGDLPMISAAPKKQQGGG